MSESAWQLIATAPTTGDAFLWRSRATGTGGIARHHLTWPEWIIINIAPGGFAINYGSSRLHDGRDHGFPGDAEWCPIAWA